MSLLGLFNLVEVIARLSQGGGQANEDGEEEDGVPLERSKNMKEYEILS